jgi:nucleotide-binding universal stress UspA family protein
MQTLPQKDYHHIRAVSRVEILRQERRLSAMPPDTFHKILVADDGSPEGERAADVAVKLGAKFKAEVILLGVVGPPNIQAEGEGLPLEDPSICRRTMEDRFERFLILGKALGVQMMVQIVEGHPAEQIRRRAEDEHVDLIVIGRHRASKGHRWFEESTHEYVLRKTTCSLMIAR